MLHGENHEKTLVNLWNSDFRQNLFFYYLKIHNRKDLKFLLNTYICNLVFFFLAIVG